MGTGNIRLSLPSQIPSCCLHFHFLSVRTNTNKAEFNVHCAFYIFALLYFSRIIFLYFGIVNFYKLPHIPPCIIESVGRQGHKQMVL